MTEAATPPEVQQARFPGQAGDVRSARRFVSDAFVVLGLPGEVHHAALATSELASNAVTHAASPFTIRVTGDAATVKVEVQDSSPSLPRSRTPSPDEPTGRGLQIVSQCSQRWGITPVDSGKVVWFEIDRLPSRDGELGFGESVPAPASPPVAEPGPQSRT